MRRTTPLLLGLFALFALGALLTKTLGPTLAHSRWLSGSDAQGLGRVTVACDPYFAYGALFGDTNRALLRARGYSLECDNDNADYAARSAALSEGRVPFAVFTRGAYVQVGGPAWDAVEVAVLSESRGSDALVGRGELNTLAALQGALSSGKPLSVAVTPSSPSWTLLKTVENTFGLELNDANIVFAEGSSDAYERLARGEVGAAVLWQPDLAQALKDPGVHELISTADTRNLVVDVLLVNRSFAQRRPEVVAAVVESFYETLELYRQDTALLVRDVRRFSRTFGHRLSDDEVRTMLAGVDFQSLADNALTWYGVADNNRGLRTYAAAESYRYLERTFVDVGVLAQPVLPAAGGDALTSSRFVAQAAQGKPLAQRQATSFAVLAGDEWAALEVVGTLRARPIGFSASRSDLSSRGKRALAEVAADLSAFSSFRLLIEGHTNAVGDAERNLALSRARAQAIADYLAERHAVDPARLHVVGYGGAKPLPCPPGDSARACASRQQRSVLTFLSPDL